MSPIADLPALFAISPGTGDGGRLERSLPLLAQEGVGAFLLRERQMNVPQRRRLALRLRELCRELGVEFWISSDVALAAEVQAQGVHLAERDPAPSRVRLELPEPVAIGVSLHRPLSRPPADLRLCRHAFLSPVFATPSKPAVEPLGCRGFEELASRVPVPSYALGGIGPAEVGELARHGIRRVAAIRLFFGDVDPAEVVRHARVALEEGGR